MWTTWWNSPFFNPSNSKSAFETIFEILSEWNIYRVSIFQKHSLLKSCPFILNPRNQITFLIHYKYQNYESTIQLKICIWMSTNWATGRGTSRPAGSSRDWYSHVENKIKLPVVLLVGHGGGTLNYQYTYVHRDFPWVSSS